MTYRVAENHDIALVSLTVLSPQPATEGVRATQRDFLADGSILEQGQYVEFRWSSLKNIAAYTTILALFGLDNADSADVTIYAKNARMAWTRYNGRAVYPMPGQDVGYRSFPRNVTILIKNLQELA